MERMEVDQDQEHGALQPMDLAPTLSWDYENSEEGKVVILSSEENFAPLLDVEQNQTL